MAHGLIDFLIQTNFLWCLILQLIKDAFSFSGKNVHVDDSTLHPW